MSLHGLVLAFEVTATIAAIAVAWKREDHRPVAAFLFICAVFNDLARLALQRWIIVPEREAMRAAGIDPTVVPFSGWVRIACDVEGALFLLWPAGLAALSLWVFTKRRPWAIAVAYAIGVAVLVAAYPTIRYDALRKFYLAAELAALAVGAGTFIRWFRTESPRIHHVVTSCILIIDLGMIFLGPWGWGLFGAWRMAHIMYAALYAVLIVLQTGVLWIWPSFSK